jgi:hypothetical protein
MRDDGFAGLQQYRRPRGMGGATKGGLDTGAILVLTLIGYATGIDPMALMSGAEMVVGGNGDVVSTAGRQGVPADATGARSWPGSAAKLRRLGARSCRSSEVCSTRGQSWCCFPE